MKKHVLFMGALAALALASPEFSSSAQATGLNVTQTAGLHASGGAADAGVQLNGNAMDEDTGLNLDTQAGLKAGAAVNGETDAQIEPSAGDAAQGDTSDSAPDSTIVTTDDDAHVTTDDGADIKLQGRVNTNMPQLNGKAGGGLDAKVSR